MILFGSMLEDLEAAYHVGYRQVYDAQFDFYDLDCYDSPWQTGIRGFLRDEPDLLAKYKTLMRYKKLSADFRKAIWLNDPTPASWVFEHPSDPLVEESLPEAMRILEECGSFRELCKRVKRSLEEQQ